MRTRTSEIPSTPQGLRELFEHLVASGNVEELVALLDSGLGDTYAKPLVPRLAARAILATDPNAVTTLAQTVLARTDSLRATVASIDVLWAVANRHETPSRGLLQPLEPLPECLELRFSEERSNQARAALSEIAATCAQSPELFWHLIQSISHITTLTANHPPEEARQFNHELFQLLTEGRFRISQSLIDQLEQLISSQQREEVYQQFFARNPIFLDPLASAVYPRQRLGLEFATDFVLRRLDDRYVVVEIEKPHNRLFTAQSDFTAELTHAFGQVLEFQQWVEDNVAYARQHLPEILAPSGLLVIGTSGSLNAREKSKLHRLNVAAPRISVITYDDVLLNAQRLYRNLRH